MAVLQRRERRLGPLRAGAFLRERAEVGADVGLESGKGSRKAAVRECEDTIPRDEERVRVEVARRRPRHDRRERRLLVRGVLARWSQDATGERVHKTIKNNCEQDSHEM